MGKYSRSFPASVGKISKRVSATLSGGELYTRAYGKKALWRQTNELDVHNQVFEQKLVKKRGRRRRGKNPLR